MDNFEELLDAVRSGAGLPDGMSAMQTIPSLLRGAFRAPEGFRFVASDLSQIELRVLAWLTDCQPMLQSFYEDRDLYIEFAAKMYHTTYSEVTKAQRQVSKPAVLSCGYGSGAGEWKQDVKKCAKCKGAGCLDCEGTGSTVDMFKSGLWGYAESMGVNMTQEEAQAAVSIYRSEYREIPNFWYSVEDPIRGLLQNPEHRTAAFGKLRFQLMGDKLLRVMLPSGRYLNYLRPALEDNQITYDTELPPTKIRGRRRLYGSLLTENLVQAIARDVMAEGMVRAADAGFKIVGHTHDELLTISPLDSRHNLTYLNNMMVDEISWCSDLPLRSEGWEGEVYRK